MIVLRILKNIISIERFRDTHPNDYRIRRGSFVVKFITVRVDGEKKFGDDTSRSW